MSNCRNKKYQQIAKIPALQPVKCIQNEQKFLNPSSPQQMWNNIFFLMNFYNRGGCLSKSFTQKILKKATALIKNQPNVVYLSDPITIVGDIHGQFYDLLEHLQKMKIYFLIVHNNQIPISKRRKVLFLGDYVDRGNFSVQVVILLLMLKIYQPKTFFLLRGNHECKEVTQIYNFRRQCQSKYNRQEIYELFIDLFWVLPLAAVVNGTYFCVHGGLSQELKTIADIQNVNRFKEIPRKGLFCDLLWSDPVSNQSGRITQDKQSEFNKSRNCSIKFGNLMTKKFFQRNDFMCIIRAHEVQEQGYGFITWGDQKEFPDVITLFSAPNYCGGFNKGAIATIEKNVIDIFPLQKRPQPFILPNFINGFQLSIPFMMAYLTQMFFCLLSPPVGFEQNMETSSIDSFQILKGKQIKNPHNKMKKNHVEWEEDHVIEQKILKKQEYLFGIYSFTKNYISNNISFKWKPEDSRSRKYTTRAQRKIP